MYIPRIISSNLYIIRRERGHGEGDPEISLIIDDAYNPFVQRPVPQGRRAGVAF